MQQRPKDEQEEVFDNRAPLSYQSQSYYNETNSCEFQNQPNPYHQNLPKSDKNQPDDYSHNDSKRILLIQRGLEKFVLYTQSIRHIVLIRDRSLLQVHHSMSERI